MPHRCRTPACSPPSSAVHAHMRTRGPDRAGVAAAYFGTELAVRRWRQEPSDGVSTGAAGLVVGAYLGTLGALSGMTLHRGGQPWLRLGGATAWDVCHQQRRGPMRPLTRTPMPALTRAVPGATRARASLVGGVVGGALGFLSGWSQQQLLGMEAAGADGPQAAHLPSPLGAEARLSGRVT